MEIRIIQALGYEQIEQARLLFREYEAWLGFSLDFQNFEQELAGLPGEYAPPRGVLFLALSDADQTVGCVALRPLEGDISEMKRLYVQPDCRGHGLGRRLCQRVIEQAAQLGYKRIRLDTLETMAAARGLYAAFGFRRIPPYRHNPLKGVEYLELALNSSR